MVIYLKYIGALIAGMACGIFSLREAFPDLFHTEEPTFQFWTIGMLGLGIMLIFGGGSISRRRKTVAPVATVPKETDVAFTNEALSRRTMAFYGAVTQSRPD